MRYLAIATLVACGPTTTARPTNVVTTTKPAALGAVKSVPCPQAAAERYRKLEHDSFEHVSVGGCIAGAFGDATIAVTISIGPPPDSQAETGTSVQIALVDAAGVERARGDGVGHGWMGGGATTALVVDLDGDGIDELVQTSSLIDQSDRIHVVRRTGATLALDSIPQDRDPSVPQDFAAPRDICELSVKLGDVRGQRTLIVTAKVREGDPPPDHIAACEPGEWVYAWERGTLRVLRAPDELQ